MKRTLFLSLLILQLSLSAYAETWFPNGWTLHRDPICTQNAFSVKSCFEKAIILTPDELEASFYLRCTHCCSYAGAVIDAPTSQGTWYRNPNGGEKLHLNPFCKTVSPQYHPLIASTRSVNVTPADICTICGHWPPQLEYLFDNIVWNASPQERAALLPGVWTVPSENAIPIEDAVTIAKRFAAEHVHETVYSAMALHYAHDARGNLRETWRVVIATPLMHPICVVDLDALTGEFLGAHISQEYSAITLMH